MALLPAHIRALLIGNYQLIGKKAGLEKAAVMEWQAQRLQHKIEELARINIDATNAYNSASRNFLYNILKEIDPILTNWFIFLYSNDINIDIDNNTNVLMESGYIQGLASSQDFYSAVKWKVNTLAIEDTIKETAGKFKIYYKSDYVDDGGELIHYKYIDLYLKHLIERYGEANIKINLNKSSITMDTKNNVIINELNNIKNNWNIKINYNNEYKYLGAFYANNDEYINENMIKKIDNLWKKLFHILQIRSNFIKFNLLTKFYGFNKINYWERCIKKCKKWMEVLQLLHNRIFEEVRCGISFSDMMKYQVPLSQKRGGLGVRSPHLFQYAAEIASLSGKVHYTEKHFPFLMESFNAYNVEQQIKQINLNTKNDNINNNENNECCDNPDSSENNNNIDNNELINQLNSKWHTFNWFNADNNEISYLEEIYGELINEHINRLNYNIEKFNAIIGPEFKYNYKLHKNHNKLIELIDNKLINNIIKDGNTYDIARINCLSNNGALSWLSIAWNQKWSIELNNQQLFVLLSLILGVKINENEYKCNGCGLMADGFGYHALSCYGSDGKALFRRHDLLCDKLGKWLKDSGYKIIKEQRYHKNNGNIERIIGRPGDIVIKNFAWDDEEPMDTYIDITIGNIFARSHLHLAQKRIRLASDLEAKKQEKYNNSKDIYGLGYEVLGGMSKNFQALLHAIAHARAARSGIKWTIWMNRLRAQLNAALMQENAKMILKSGIIQYVSEESYYIL